MTAASVTVAGRLAAERLMVDACTITRSAGNAGLNEVTGRTVPRATTVYSGPCQVQVPDTQPQTPEVGERTATVQRLTVKIPVSVTGVRVGDRVTLTTAALDGDLAGRTYRVAGLHDKTYATSRRLACEETTG